jgi:hypothetical protein
MTDIIIDTIYGDAPMQADGTIGGIRFYFKARGAKWKMLIGAVPLAKDSWSYSEPFGKDFEAGFMTQDQVRAAIHKAGGLYLVSDAYQNMSPFDRHRAAKAAWLVALIETFGDDAMAAQSDDRAKGKRDTRLRELYDCHIAKLKQLREVQPDALEAVFAPA